MKLSAIIFALVFSLFLPAVVNAKTKTESKCIRGYVFITTYVEVRNEYRLKHAPKLCYDKDRKRSSKRNYCTRFIAEWEPIGTTQLFIQRNGRSVPQRCGK